MAPSSKRVYKGRQAIDFIMANPGKRLSIEAISKGVGGWTPASISGLCGKMVRDYPDNMTRVGAGVYMWTLSDDAAAPAERPRKAVGDTELAFTVLTRKDDGSMLARDIDNGIVYVIRPLDF